MRYIAMLVALVLVVYATAAVHAYVNANEGMRKARVILAERGTE